MILAETLKKDPWFLMRVALEWSWLDEDLVGHKLIKHIADNWGEDLGVLFPRGHGKTLPMSAIVISAIINNPNIAILQMSRTEDNAQKFGSFVAEQLIGNDMLQECFSRKFDERNGFLPSTTSECKNWGKDGYTLPWRKPRIDPTLLNIPMKGAKAGKHPDLVYIDDLTEKENNNERGWQEVKEVVQGLWFLLPAHGHIIWTATRWHDSDPVGMAERGKLEGKQGRFKTIKESCYVDDNPQKGPTYPKKVRWNESIQSGYTLETLDAKRRPESEGGLGEFFDAQMRNDPAPRERADIKVEDINIYSPESLPKLGRVILMGIETTGGGAPIYSGLIEKADELKIDMPLTEITTSRNKEKKDRILAAIQPLTSSGRLYAQKWMMGEPEDTDTLQYELKRLGKAAHDDIADALHNVPVHMSGNIRPEAGQPAHLYISVDLAWSEAKRADWTVVMAVAVDHKGNHWIVDYERFQLSSPTAMYDRLISFFRKFEEPQKLRRSGSSKKYPGAWR